MSAAALRRSEMMRELSMGGTTPEASAGGASATSKKEAIAIDCGWGRLLFGQTFPEPRAMAEALLEEAPGERDVAFYVEDPHVMLAAEPQALFLDPSHTYRLDLSRPVGRKPSARVIVEDARPGDEAAIRALYRGRGMVPPRKGFLSGRPPGCVDLLVARKPGGGKRAGDGLPGEELLGVVMGVDHVCAFGDPDGGSSLWALAVDPRIARPGVGLSLVLALADRFRTRGRRTMDLSVMHDNAEAISLYEKLGFQRVQVFCVKTRNAINQSLYVGPAEDAELNIYARIIVDEARRRGIAVEVEDAQAGLFSLHLGARSFCFRESLGDLTTAVAMSRCDDKALTRRLLEREGLSVPDQAVAKDETAVRRFLEKHERIVVKPARGEQGRGVYVDIRELAPAMAAVAELQEQTDLVLLEQFVQGQDLRIIVIDGEAVAAAVRRPAEVEGDGKLTVEALIEKQSRRRAAATGGESHIPLDAETERCLAAEGVSRETVLPEGRRLAVRKTANLHTGGTIHDVTDVLHPRLAEAAVKAAEVLHMPVVGFDFMVEAPDKPTYHIIEANERPGLANHEPAPTAERFIDLYFPETRSERLPLRGIHAKAGD